MREGVLSGGCRCLLTLPVCSAPQCDKQVPLNTTSWEGEVGIRDTTALLEPGSYRGSVMQVDNKNHVFMTP